jgi:hypothetical protein
MALPLSIGVTNHYTGNKGDASFSDGKSCLTSLFSQAYSRLQTSMCINWYYAGCFAHACLHTDTHTHTVNKECNNFNIIEIPPMTKTYTCIVHLGRKNKLCYKRVKMALCSTN